MKTVFPDINKFDVGDIIRVPVPERMPLEIPQERVVFAWEYYGVTLMSNGEQTWKSWVKVASPRPTFSYYLRGTKS
jgi:hypothetical protein